MIRKAIISDCGTYRYRLSRTWDKAGKKVVFLMLNPSKADGKEDDPTIRRCINFAKAWGYGGIIVVNIFAYRETDPDILNKVGKKEGVDYVIGPENNDYIRKACKGRKVVIAWGIRGWTLWQHERVVNMLREMKVKMYYLRLSSLWFIPCHPLYLPKKLKPKRYRPWREK